MRVSQEAEIKRSQIPAEYRADGADGGALTSNFAFARERENLGVESAQSAPSIPRDGEFSHSQYELHSQALATTLDEGEGASIMLSGAQQQKRIGDEAQGSRKRRDREQYYLDALDAHIARLDARIAEIDADIQRINTRRLEIGDQLEALDELERLNTSGKLDVRNAEHQKLLKKAGVPPNASTADIAVLVENERKNLGSEDDALEQESNDLIKERGTLQAERDEALSVRDALEKADTPEALEIAQERAQSIMGQTALNGAAYLSGDTNDKIAAANMIGRVDAGQSNDKLALASATEDRGEVMDADIDDFSFDAPAP